MSSSPVDQPPEMPEDIPDKVYAERRKDGCYAFFTCLGIMLLVVIVIAVAPTLIGVNILGSLADSLGSAFNQPPMAQTMSTRTVVTGIQPLGQLVSISAQLAKADIQVGVRQGGLNACGFSANHVAQGTVEGGIDLSAITEEDVTYDTASDTYTVRLPMPQLTSCRIDFIRQYARSTTVCNVDWDEARVLAQYIALSDFREDALEGGILNRARAEAGIVIGNFVRALTGSDVDIVFNEDAAPAVPASCIPQPPEGWVFDETNQAWVKVS